MSWTTKKHLTNTFQTTTFKVEENSRTFQELAEKCKDFSRNYPKNFKDFPRLCKSRANRHIINNYFHGREREITPLVLIYSNSKDGELTAVLYKFVSL